MSADYRLVAAVPGVMFKLVRTANWNFLILDVTSLGLLERKWTGFHISLVRMLMHGKPVGSSIPPKACSMGILHEGYRS